MSRNNKSGKKYPTLKRDKNSNSQRRNRDTHTMLTNKGYSVEIDEDDFNIIKDHKIRLTSSYGGPQKYCRELFERHTGIIRLNRKPGYKLKKEYRKYGRFIMATIMTILSGNAINNTEMNTVKIKNLPVWVRPLNHPTRVDYNLGRRRNSNLRPIKTLTGNTNGIEFKSYYNDNDNNDNNDIPINNIGIKAKGYKNFLRNKEYENHFRRTEKKRTTQYKNSNFPEYTPQPKVNLTKLPLKSSMKRK